MTRVVILTGAELRHRFVRKALALSPGLQVVRSVCESEKGALTERVSAKEDASLQTAHLRAREQSERDFFGVFDELAPDQSNPLQIERGTLNDPALLADLLRLEPEVVVSYGCSILRPRFISAFPRRILNVHLGLSPYYRGGGTNFWPLVNGEPEFVGVTFMHIDAGIDTGEIIHQLRPTISPGDGPHQIGNRLIAQMVAPLARAAARLPTLAPMPQPSEIVGREYRMRDFTEDSVARLRAHLSEGLIERYLAESEARLANAPIVEHPGIAP